MPSEDKYDDTASLFLFLFVLAAILLISTIIYLKSWYNLLVQYQQQKKKKIQTISFMPSFGGILKFILWVALWVVFLWVINNLQIEEENAQFDPYEILGVSQGASDSEIKKAFRTLTLKWHPDKNPDPGAEEMYIKIRKAHETLTDPAVREKWEKYGNPDGPQTISVGVALPSFLVDSKNTSLVLGFYVIFLVIIFPTIAICFWNRQKSVAHNELLNETMKLYLGFIKENHRFKKLIIPLSLSAEYTNRIPLRTSDEESLRKLKSLTPVEEETKKGKKMLLPQLVKHRMLFHAHFSRLHDSLSPQLRSDLEFLLQHSLHLLGGMAEASFVRGLLIPTVSILQMSQMMVQAIWNESSRSGVNTTLYQIPHMNEEVLKKCNSKKWKMNNNILSFIRLEREKKKELFGEITDEQLDEIEDVCKTMPHDVDFHCTFKVNEEHAENQVITTNSIVAMVANFDMPSRPEDTEEPIEVHAPFFPLPKKENWWIILGNERTHRLLQVPKKITCMKDKATAKIEFQAPPKAGVYPLTCWLICDSYAGFDKKISVKLVVKEAPKVAPVQEKEEDSDEELSEEEEKEEEEEVVEEEDNDLVESDED